MFLILTPDIVLCTFFRSFQMRHFTHIWQNPPDFFARYQVITFQHCIKAQEKVFRYISTSQLDDLKEYLFQNRHKPGEAAETAAVQQRRRDRLQLWLR